METEVVQVEKYDIEGLLSFIPRRFEDDRGLFFESFNQKVFQELVGDPIEFVQDNVSHSKKNVVRGLHFQVPPHAQGKLVRVTSGKALDVAVDLRKSSPTYGQHVCVELDPDLGRVFWIPAGFAHGFSALEDHTVFNYKCTDYYHPASEQAILWNDPSLSIDWQILGDAVVSAKDQEAETFESFDSPF